MLASVMPCIAVLDDEPGFRQALSRLLRAHDLKVQAFATSKEFTTAATGQKFACLLLDLHMPDSTGFDVLADLKERGLDLPVIIITGHDQPGSAATARELGASNYLLKPLDETALLSSIREAAPALWTTG
jgi:two-component system response regulator FixJ